MSTRRRASGRCERLGTTDLAVCGRLRKASSSDLAATCARTETPAPSAFATGRRIRTASDPTCTALCTAITRQSLYSSTTAVSPPSPSSFTFASQVDLLPLRHFSTLSSPPQFSLSTSQSPTTLPTLPPSISRFRQSHVNAVALTLATPAQTQSPSAVVDASSRRNESSRRLIARNGTCPSNIAALSAFGNAHRANPSRTTCTLINQGPSAHLTSHKLYTSNIHVFALTSPSIPSDHYSHT